VADRPTPRFDLPTPDIDTQPFWDAAKEHKLLVKRCGACGAHFHYPRPFCPKCWSADVSWVEASGRGTVYTFSVVHQNDLPPWPSRVPYVAAIVELEEGPRLMSMVVECEHDAVECGLPVEVTFEVRDDEFTVPVFRPAVRTGG
jgi:uncharacterized OB-fold protein